MINRPINVFISQTVQPELLGVYMWLYMLLFRLICLSLEVVLMRKCDLKINLKILALLELEVKKKFLKEVIHMYSISAATMQEPVFCNYWLTTSSVSSTRRYTHNKASPE